MVYIITDVADVNKVMLVKCENRKDIEGRLKLQENQRIVGTLTTSEISTLDTASFAVIVA